jgi:hypothetical protein
MNLTALLGRRLKDDEILDVLECFQVEEVIYDFDRNHENLEDVYWAAARSAGFQLRFDKHQVLDTVFCYVVADEGFLPIATEIIGAPVHPTFEAAEAACQRARQTYSVSDSSRGPKFHKWWLKVESPAYSTHYQFKAGVLFRITLALPKLSSRR